MVAAALRRLMLLACVLGVAVAGAQTPDAARAPIVAPVVAPTTVQAAPAAKPVKTDPLRAADAYLAGARLLDRKDLAGAQAEFARAAALDPTHSDYVLALTLTREHRVSELIQQAAKARMTNHEGEAVVLLAQARAIDPENELVVQHPEAHHHIHAPGRHRHVSQVGLDHHDIGERREVARRRFDGARSVQGDQ